MTVVKAASMQVLLALVGLIAIFDTVVAGGGLQKTCDGRGEWTHVESAEIGMPWASHADQTQQRPHLACPWRAAADEALAVCALRAALATRAGRACPTAAVLSPAGAATAERLINKASERDTHSCRKACPFDSGGMPATVGPESFASSAAGELCCPCIVVFCSVASGVLATQCSPCRSPGHWSSCRRTGGPAGIFSSRMWACRGTENLCAQPRQLQRPGILYCGSPAAVLMGPPATLGPLQALAPLHMHIRLI